MNTLPYHAASQVYQPPIEAPDNTFGRFPELTEVVVEVPPGPEAAPVDPMHPRRERSNKQAARVGGVLMGALSVPTAAGYICDFAHKNTFEKALACATSAPSARWGGALLRQAPSVISAPFGYRWPQTLYVTHRAEKYADVLTALYGMLWDNVPWENERALVMRLPGGEYPSDCNPRMGLPQCPDVLAWSRAAHVAPYVEGFICIVTGVVVGAFVGAVIWRDGGRAIAKIFPDIVELRPGEAEFTRGGRPRVVAAQGEVRRRQVAAGLQGPEPDEHTPLLAQDRFRKNRTCGIAGTKKENIVDAVRHGLSSLAWVDSTASGFRPAARKSRDARRSNPSA